MKWNLEDVKGLASKLAAKSAIENWAIPGCCGAVAWVIGRATRRLSGFELAILFAAVAIAIGYWFRMRRHTPREATDWLEELADDGLALKTKAEAVEWRAYVFAALFGGNWSFLLDDWQLISFQIENAPSDAESVHKAKACAYWLRTRAAKQRVLDPMVASQIGQGRISPVVEQVQALLGVRPTVLTKDSVKSWTLSVVRLLSIVGPMSRAIELETEAKPLYGESQLGESDLAKIMERGEFLLKACAAQATSSA